MLYDALVIVLNDDRDALYNRINKRVDVMLEEGLLDEVKSFLNTLVSRFETIERCLWQKKP